MPEALGDMTLPSEFVLLHYGKRIIMLADCILDRITNILFSYLPMVFVCDIQKSSIASHLKGLDYSYQFYYQGPAFTCI